MKKALAVRPFAYTDIPFPEWQQMWLDYVGVHASKVEPSVHRHTFERICAVNASLHGFVAFSDRPLGFAHYFFHPSTFNMKDACTIEDLYVCATARGQGVGRWLIETVAQKARLAAAPALHWRTDAANIGAIRLYESLAVRGESLNFRMQL